MNSAEYIAFLWRVISAMGVIIAGLAGALWWHVLIDKQRAVDLQKCKDALGINGK